jgi:hypothetical protein
MAHVLNPGPERRPKRNGPGAAEYHLQHELARLKSAEVTPREALEVAMAVWLLSLEQPAVLPDDLRLTKALGNAVLRIAKLRKIEVWVNGERRITSRRPPPGEAVTLLGTRLRENFGLLAFALERLIASDRHVRNTELSKRKALARSYQVPIRIHKPVKSEIPAVPLDQIS